MLIDIQYMESIGQLQYYTKTPPKLINYDQVGTILSGDQFRHDYHTFFLLHTTSDLGLLVVLHGHCDDVEPYDNGDEEIQVVARAHLVDNQTGGGVIGVVGLTLSFC